MLLIWTLLPNLTFYLITRGFHRTFATGAGMPTEDAYSSGHLVLFHFGTCMCSNVETNPPLNLSCLRTFEFPTSLGTSVLNRTVSMPWHAIAVSSKSKLSSKSYGPVTNYCFVHFYLVLGDLTSNKVNTSDKETSFLDSNVKVIGSDVHTSVYDNRDDFGFPIWSMSQT